MDTVQRQASYDIGGVRYPQPFKIRRLGHFGFNVPDLEAGIDFYARLLGFRITDTRDFSKIPGREEMASRMQDPRIVFMSHNSDHHAFLPAHKSMGAIFGDAAVSKDVTVNQNWATIRGSAHRVNSAPVSSRTWRAGDRSPMSSTSRKVRAVRGKS